ncbi:MAG: DUF4145 domain-containing protein [Spirochaetota bacterium]
MDALKIQETDSFSVGNTIKCYCNKCRNDLNHTVIKSIKEEWKENVFEYGADGYTDYQIIKCTGCDSFTFRESKYHSEYRDIESDGTYELLYPESSANFRDEMNFDDLPYNLETIYRETIICFNKNLKTLCAAGIRSILEGICRDRKIRKGHIEYKEKNGIVKSKYSSNLDGKINGLVENEIITKGQAQALHELRFLGNKAVHELDSPSLKDLSIALEIIEHIIIDIYDLPLKSKKLERRRAKST